MVRRTRLVALVLATAMLGAIGGASSAGAAPGNNGTVKIDGVDILKQMNANEPHVGCDFSVEWYGFDANAVSEVTFEAQPPTGWRTLLHDTVHLDGDDASGGGSPAGFDGQAFYRLDFDPVLDYMHPKQGFHVKLTVNTTGSIGSDVKHKVFWVQGCDTQPPV